VFGTQGLEYWVEDTMRVRYASLLRLEREKDQEEANLDPEELQHCEVVDSPPKVLDNHTLLYKAMATTSSLDSHPLFLDNGHLNISSLSSPRGGDFQRTELSDISYTSAPHSRVVSSIYLSPLPVVLYLPYLPLHP
jgi:hypothetical protein